ncbi:unnamed protein product [Cylicocyclus nassatus]|uniref:Transthyretin-like family protein n=1 Tax=Cylicocyclus nassatus TaxID=53992 RepID=A0AA36H4T7_CYLNA|nr:unnamed protein product [Cylicocyclus nassatus]
MKLLLMILAGVLAIVNTKLQRINAQGTLSCFGKPVHGATVELWERNEKGPNDLLATTTSKNGTYSLDGSEDEEGALEPFLVIIHNCNVTCKGCHQSLVYELRDSCRCKKTITHKSFGLSEMRLETEKWLAR